MHTDQITFHTALRDRKTRGVTLESATRNHEWHLNIKGRACACHHPDMIGRNLFQ